MSVQREDRLIWTIAILIALVWHVFAWLRITEQPEEEMTTAQRVAPELTYLPEYASNAATAESDARTLMTPVLFSLPSTVGFSKPIMQYREGMQEGNYKLRKDMAFLEHSITPRDENFLSWPRHMDSQVAFILNNPAITKPRTTLSRDRIVDPKPSVYVSFTGELDGNLFESREIDPELEKTFEPPWKATAAVSFDQAGLPTQLFLETPTEQPELNSAIVRNLYTWRLQSGSGPASGKIILQFN